MNVNLNSMKLKGKQVDELVDLINSSKTLMIVLVKGLPSKQFQEIKKSLRKDALIKINKKNIISRALKKFGKESITPLEKYVDADIALVLSNLEGYELASLLVKKRTRVYAKNGQIADADIEVKEGPTDLVPGPAISDLSALGIQISVEGGKIAIKAPKIVVRKGEEIKENVASILQKLKIQPFKVGLKPLIFYDLVNEKIYDNIDIDSDKFTKELIKTSIKALGLARKIGYYCKETISYFLVKASREGEILTNKINAESKVSK